MKKVVVSMLILGVVLAVALIGAIALFTDQEEIGNNTFSTGTLDLASDPATAMFTVTNMAPGDVTYSDIELTNDGSLELRYAMTTTPDAGDLDEQLTLTIDVMDDDYSEVLFDDIYDGALSSAFIGNTTAGNQAGDRTLVAATGIEYLRFTVTLPLNTGNSFQNTDCTVAFVFDAEQTKNNP